jgi:hypothetical protein
MKLRDEWGTRFWLLAHPVMKLRDEWGTHFLCWMKLLAPEPHDGSFAALWMTCLMVEVLAIPLTHLWHMK